MIPPSPASLPPAAPAAPLAALDADAVLAQARALCRAAERGEVKELLRGRRLALLCATDGQPEAALLERAAKALGASVTRLRPPSGAADEWRLTARVLGRLYDAIECEGLPAGLVAELVRAAGVPVYAGLATASHPIVAWADRLVDGSVEERRQRVLQAALALMLR